MSEYKEIYLEDLQKDSHDTTIDQSHQPRLEDLLQLEEDAIAPLSGL